MTIRPFPWRSVPDGTIVLNHEGRPFVAGRWLGPDPNDPRNAWRLLGDVPALVGLDDLVPTLAAPESAIVMMFEQAGFSIEGVLACPDG